MVTDKSKEPINRIADYVDFLLANIDQLRKDDIDNKYYSGQRLTCIMIKQYIEIYTKPINT